MPTNPCDARYLLKKQVPDGTSRGREGEEEGEFLCSIEIWDDGTEYVVMAKEEDK